MLSRKTTIGIALMVLPQAAPLFSALRDGNIYAFLSRNSPAGITPEQFEGHYGTPVFDISPGYKMLEGFHDLSFAYNHGMPYIEPEAEYVRMGGCYGIDSGIWLEHPPLYEMDEAFYEEHYLDEDGEAHGDEEAPLDLLISKIAQVLDWEEIFADEDFTILSNAVFFENNGISDAMMEDTQRVIALNAALSHHGLPDTDELLKDYRTVGHAPLVPLAEEFIASCETDPRELRGPWYLEAC